MVRKVLDLQTYMIWAQKNVELDIAANFWIIDMAQ